MRHSISDTAEYGDYVSGPRVVSPAVKQEMHNILDEIRDGSFAKRWIKENETSARPGFQGMRAREHDHSIEQVGAKLREMMPFLDPVRDPAE